MEKETKIILMIFLFALVLRIAFVFSSSSVIWDESVYLNLGYALSSNPLDYSLRGEGWSDFIPLTDIDYAWPKIGFRAPLLPYTLAVFYFFNLDFLIFLLMPFMGALSAVLVYFLGKRLFNKDVGFYSAVFIAIVPFHILYSSRILTDIIATFLITLSVLFFWKGFEKEDNKFKILFGFVFALSIFSRYNSLWMVPIFLIYLLAYKRNFFKDRYFWISILVFLIVLIPIFIYGYFEYDHILGAFIHGGKASMYWGGIQTWHLYLDYFFTMFGIVGLVFIFSLIYIIRNSLKNKAVYFLLIWILVFLALASFMPHKEDRYILPIVSAVCILSGYFISRIKNGRLILAGILILALIFTANNFHTLYNTSFTESNLCFMGANNFLKETNSVIITDESSVVFFYTKQETRFFPGSLRADAVRTIKSEYAKDVYLLFSDKNVRENVLELKKEFDGNFESPFRCEKDKAFSIVYRIE